MSGLQEHFSGSPALVISFKQSHTVGRNTWGFLSFCFFKCPVSKVRERAGGILYVNVKPVMLDNMQRLIPG